MAGASRSSSSGTQPGRVRSGWPGPSGRPTLSGLWRPACPAGCLRRRRFGAEHCPPGAPTLSFVPLSVLLVGTAGTARGPAPEDPARGGPGPGCSPDNLPSARARGGSFARVLHKVRAGRLCPPAGPPRAVRLLHGVFELFLSLKVRAIFSSTTVQHLTPAPETYLTRPPSVPFRRAVSVNPEQRLQFRGAAEGEMHRAQASLRQP